MIHGSSRALLELNHMVLYGAEDADNDYHYHQRAMDASEVRFYNGDEVAMVQGVTGGIADLVGWYEHHRRLDPLERAAGIMIRTLASPQLFVEGNHRTSVLLASHELIRAGEPPLVFSAEHAIGLTECLKPIQRLTRGSLAIWIHERRLRKKLAQLIALSANREHLLE